LRANLGLKPGRKVFISAAPGGVGTFAIQMRQVAGRPCGPRPLRRGEKALVRALGADAVIDYTTDDLSRIGKISTRASIWFGGETWTRC